MTVYYKATSLDARDFRTGTVAYVVGEVSVPRPFDGKPQLCGPGLLHAATVPAMTLVGGSWPCRLFEVTGKPVAGLDARHPHKAGFASLRVEREVEAWRALGPNGQEVAALIERASRLTAEEVRAFVAWYVSRCEAYHAARDAAMDAAMDAARDAAMDAAMGVARGGAWYAARGAARALVVRDLISDKHFNTLYDPWHKVTTKEAQA